jgi:hypothetical protein
MRATLKIFLATVGVVIAAGALAENGGPATFADTLAWAETNRSASPDFHPGDTLRRADLNRMAPFVPPGFLAELDFAEFEAAIQKKRRFGAHPVFEAASLQYGPQTEIAADGSLLNHVAGRPFSHARIASAAPDQAGYMVVWNYVHRWQHYGYASDAIHLLFLRPGAPIGRDAASSVLRGGGVVERHMLERFQRVYLSRLAVEADNDYQLDVEGGGTLLHKDYISFTDPFEVRGNTFVIERSLDPHERDQVNSYLATERRVRRLSPKERADAFVGSEFTLDDFEGFSGRVLDYEWTFHGKKDLLYVADVRGERPLFFGPTSTAPWDQWQLRPCYVIEQRPLLAEHSYGRSLVFVDAESSIIALKLVFDRSDALLKVIYPLYRWPLEEGQLASAEPRETVGVWMGNVAINVQTRIASMVWSDDVEIPDVKPAHVRRLFSVTNLSAGR